MSSRALTLLLLGCLAAPAHAQQPAPAAVFNQILEPEIRASAAQTAFEVVQTLRPQWLQRRRATTIGGPVSGTLPVFLDGALLGDLEAMHDVSAATIRRIEFLDPAAVSRRFQRSSPNGGILLSTSPYADAAGFSGGAVVWDGRDADDYFAVQVSTGWGRPDGSGPRAGRLQRGTSTVAGVVVPLRPDVFMRVNYFRHAFEPAAMQAPQPDDVHRVSWSGGSLEWKGQLSDTDRFTPYAVAGVSFQWLREHTEPDPSETTALGYLVGLGLDVRISGPVTAFMEAGYAKAMGAEVTARIPLAAVQPLRAGLSLAPLRLARR